MLNFMVLEVGANPAASEERLLLTRSIEFHKSEARGAAAERRKQAHSLESQSRAVARLAAWTDEQRSGGPLAGYLAVGTEIDPIELMVSMHASSRRRICVPVTGTGDAPLRFREWEPGTELEPGPFRVCVPVSGDWLIPEIIIVPLLAFDRRGHRLGYGGGHYDRTLRRLRGIRNVTAVGLAFAAQESDLLPVAEFDQRLDAVVTEKQIILTGKTGMESP